MVKNILFIGIVLELIIFSTIIILEMDPKVASNVPLKEMAIYEEKSISGAFLDKEVLPVTNSTASLSNIKADYHLLFKALEEETHSKLQDLANRAYEEYIEGEQDLIGLLSMSKYANELKVLEEETDEAFYQIYDELSQELVINGYSETEAIEFKTQYESKKENQIKEIIKMATSEMSAH